MKVVKREKSTSTRGHYVTNSQLLPAVIEAKALGKVTDKLIGMIWMIAERYSRKSNFIGYSFREDMVASAVANLWNNALKFNPEKSSNPFSFYTTAIHNSFLQYLADEKKHRTVRDLLLIDAGANPSFNYVASDDGATHDSDNGYNPTVSGPEIEDDDKVDVSAMVSDEFTGEEIAAPKAKVLSVRQESRQQGEVKTLQPGIDFTQDENGTIIFLNGKTMELSAPVPPKPPKKSRAKKEAVEKPKKAKVEKVVDSEKTKRSKTT